MGADTNTLKAIHKEAGKEKRVSRDMSILAKLQSDVELLDDLVDCVEERQERMRDDLQNEAVERQNALDASLNQLSARLDRTVLGIKKALQDKGVPLPRCARSSRSNSKNATPAPLTEVAV
jgi:hypothetical protein